MSYTTLPNVLKTLPFEYQQSWRAHPIKDLVELEELAAELALAYLEGRTPAQARSRTRKFSEGGNGRVSSRRQVEVEDWFEGCSTADQADPLVKVEAEEQAKIDAVLGDAVVNAAEIQKRLNCSRRKSFYVQKQQIERAKINGDIFAQGANPDKKMDQEIAARRERIAQMKRERRGSAAKTVAIQPVKKSNPAKPAALENQLNLF